MAVVVQRMIQPRAAGVLFTADPVRSDRSRMVLEAVPGLGEALVQGSRTPDRYVLDHARGHIREQTLAQPDADPMLSAEQVASLHGLARRVEAHFRQPQDLEWAIDADGKVWLLQARPITTLEPEADLPELPAPPARAAPLIFELFPEGVAPLDVDVGFGVVVSALNPAPGLRQLPLPFVWHEGVPVTLAWRRLLWQLPLRLATLVRAVGYNPDDWFGRELPRLQEDDERLGWADPASQGDAALYTHITAVAAALRRTSGQRWPAVLGAGLRALPALVGARWAVGRREPMSTLVADLCAGVPTVTTLMNAELADLARVVREDPSLDRIWAETPPPAMLDHLAAAGEPAVRALGDRITSFLRRWGRREDRGLSIRMAPWEAQPERVITLIGALAAAPLGSATTDAAAARERARAAEGRVLRRVPAGLRGMVRRSIGALRTFTRLREDSHFYIFALGLLARRSLLELGQRWEQAGLLKTADEVFLLRLAEIESAIHGTTDPRRILSERRPVWMAMQRQWRAWQTVVTPTGAFLRGVGISPGQVTGPARIVLEPAAFGQFRPGEVLVAPATGPAWTPLFRAAAAVVTETGGTMSHAAIVAREYGLPGVSGVRGATSALHNGEVVTVDGNAGLVRRPLGHDQ